MSRSSFGSFTPASRRISVRWAEPGLPRMSFAGSSMVSCECSLVEFSRLLAPGGPRFRLISKAYVSALAARRAKRPSRSSRGQTTLPKNEAVWIMLGSWSIASSPGALEDPPYASPMTTIRFAAPKILTSQRMDTLASPACVALLPAAVRRPRECLDPRYAFDASLLLRVCQCGLARARREGPAS